MQKERNKEREKEKKKERKKKRLNEGNNNSQATHGARKPPGPIFKNTDCAPRKRNSL